MSDDKIKTSKPSQVMDVSHPGKTAPTGNSKSVIVTHRAVIQDPMVTGDSEKASDSIAAKRTAPVLKPAAKTDDAVEPEAPTEQSAPVDKPAVHKELNLLPPSSQKPEDKPVDDTPKTETRSNDKAETIGEVSQDGKTAKALPTVDELEADKLKKETELQKTIDSKKYFLPINTLENQRTKRFIALGIVLSLVLIAAWLDISLDAGLVHIGGLHSLTHFFSS